MSMQVTCIYVLDAYINDLYIHDMYLFGMAIDMVLWTFSLSRSCSRTDCRPLAYLTGADLTASRITVLRYVSILSHQGQVHEEMLKPFWKLSIRCTQTSDLAEGDLTQFLHTQ